ncbi:MAG: hypothetical protein ABSH30_02960 [Acidimicrobiales bacterium]|jgi:uncharacterized membrane protein YphA (DoxX/SURF4 family)
MTLSQRLGRPLFAGIFVVGGLDAVRNPSSKVDKADVVVPRLLKPLGISADTATVVRANGAVQVAAAGLLAAGIAPRLAAGTLLASLIPTTAAGHRFWEEEEAGNRDAQRLQFMKNVAIMGGLIMAMSGPRAGSRRRRRPASHETAG